MLNEGLENIGNGAFYGCSALQEIKLPVNVLTIGQESFANCKSLKKVVLNEGLESIGVMAFSGCTNLTIPSVPEGTAVAHGAFKGCKK